MIVIMITAILSVIINVYLLIRIKKLKALINTITIASKSKSLFIQKLAYEFRNPLNGISGFAEMLESGYFGDLSLKQKERVHDIYICGVQLHNFIKDLMDLSKGTSGGIELIETFTPLSTLIARAIEEVKAKISYNKIRIVTDLESTTCEIFGDQNKLTQAFKHIIDNAVKFSSQDGQVTITQSHIPTQQQPFKIIIADSGLGMSRGELQTLFLFPDDTNKTINFNNGLGIGMPLTKVFIELHGGKIQVESEEGLGTTTTVLLPETRIRY